MYHYEWHFDSMYYRIVLRSTNSVRFAAEGDGFLDSIRFAFCVVAWNRCRNGTQTND